MEGPLVSATTQAVVMGALSNVFAQGYTAYRTNSLKALDIASFVHFLINATLVQHLAVSQNSWQLLSVIGQIFKHLEDQS